MMTHPLTDQICEELSVYQSNCDDETITDMRAAADWQLEQVIEWLGDYPAVADVFDAHGIEGVIQELEEEMRLQEQDDT